MRANLHASLHAATAWRRSWRVIFREACGANRFVSILALRFASATSGRLAMRAGAERHFGRLRRPLARTRRIGRLVDAGLFDGLDAKRAGFNVMRAAGLVALPHLVRDQCVEFILRLGHIVLL